MPLPRLIFVFLMSLNATFASPAEQLIKKLKMEKIPVEGAWFALTYTSTEQLAAAALPARYGAPRAVGGAIYALVTPVDFSAMHKLKTDEIWHYYAGDPMELLLLHPEGHSEVIVVGPDVFAGQQPQYTVRHGVWMGARPLSKKADAYTLFGTTMAPGFDYADFETGYRDELQKAYPQHAALIGELTREECATRPAASASTSAVAAPVAEPGSLVFRPEVMAEMIAAPGVVLRELVGRTGHARTERASIARFTLTPGKTTGTSYNKFGEEYFLVIAGEGVVNLDGVKTPVSAGSVVLMKAGSKHSITAAANAALEFYAITTPAFSLDDYVRVSNEP